MSIPIDRISKVERTQKDNYTFSILIPTWNNLPYLQNCLESLDAHSSFDHQLIVFVNDGSDGTLEWLAEHSRPDLDYFHAPENVGICYGLNSCRSLIKADYVVYLNDDMYVLPGWDSHLMTEIKELGTKAFSLSATMIEPRESGNSCVIVKDFGQDIQSFEKEALVAGFEQLEKADWSGSTWPPVVVHRDIWDLVGGLSIEFNPGMYSDPDFSRKLYEAGVRIFKGVGKSKVYHFSGRSTKRVKQNKGKRQFLQKWGYSSGTFTRHFLKWGQPFTGAVSDETLNTKLNIKNLIARIRASFK